MKVKANKNTSRLVKGADYKVLSINIIPITGSKFRPKITVEIGGKAMTFSSLSFTNVDGTQIKPKNWQDPSYSKVDYSETRIGSVTELKKGDIIICEYESTFFFESGKKYKVSDILYKETQRQSFNGNYYTQSEQKIKVEGYNGWIRHYRFRHPTTQEKRQLSLSSIFNESQEMSDIEIIKSKRSKRKIDRISDTEKAKVILGMILNSMIDPSRNSLSIIDWALQKKAKGYGITEKDLAPYLNKKMKDIIKIVDDI